jgi:hypothetical protein
MNALSRNGKAVQTKLPSGIVMIPEAETTQMPNLIFFGQMYKLLPQQYLHGYRALM